MTHMLWWWACSAPQEEPESLPEPEPETTSTPVPCSGPWLPEPLDTDVFYQTDLYFFTREREPDANIVVTGPDGEELPGTTDVERRFVTWQGDPLLPLTTYEVALTLPGSEQRCSWTTSSTGMPLEVDPTGQVYSVSLAEGHWKHPMNSNDFVPELRLLVSPAVLGEQGVTMSVASTCMPTTSLTSQSWPSPAFEVSSTEPVPLLQGVWLYSPQLSGAFAPDGQRLQAVLTGQLRARELKSMFGVDETDDVCDWSFALMATPCEPCDHDETEDCLELWIEDLEGLLTDPERVESDGSCP